MRDSFKIYVQHLTKQFKNGNIPLTILRNVSIAFETGKTYAIMGASGSGKSTFLHLLAGLDIPTSGEVFIEKKSIQTLSALERSSYIGIVFQFPYLIKELNVLENMVLAGVLHGFSEEESEQKAYELLQKMGLQQTEKWFVGALSGGQKQRIAIARALMADPHFLIADEPTGSLDEKNGELVMQTLLSFKREKNMGLIISTHNTLLAHLMEHVFILKDGTLHEDIKRGGVHYQEKQI